MNEEKIFKTYLLNKDVLICQDSFYKQSYQQLHLFEYALCCNVPRLSTNLL